MKIVVDSRMVAHLWANQSQATARNAGNTFHFHHDIIYSYGIHFPIARHITHQGKHAILMTTRKYSVTTSGHQSDVRQAIKAGTLIFYVENVMLEPREMLKWYRAEMQAYQDKAGQAKMPHKAGHRQEAMRVADKANKYAEFFGLKTRLTTGAPSIDELNAQREFRVKQAERQAKAETTREANRIKRIEQAKKDHDERMVKWLNGENVHTGCYYGDKTRLRINGDTIQTSRGAEVPVAHAIKALPFIRSGKEWHRNGQEIRVGQFHFDSIDAAGNVKAGCHTIDRDEIERIAAILGL